MINFAVDDLDAVLAKLRVKKLPVIERQQDENGRFASILDPDGTKLELWKPNRTKFLRMHPVVNAVRPASV